MSAIPAAAREARAAIEKLLDVLGWPTDTALSVAIDRCLQLEEGEE